ncbi:MAG TPA: HAD-IA family hydrolase, partial [Polyangiaceae bacterium]|nr:HAD-IA family hydrolase [Polyangiaceae bacterium]
EEVETSLRNVGLTGLFRAIVTGTEVTRGKPDPEIMLRCAADLGVPPSECLVIEDGELGIEAARRAGMDWVRVESDPPAF